MRSDSIHLPAASRTFYHGTSKFSARHILRQGFRDWSWTDNSLRFRYRKKEGADRHKHGGAFGCGTYVTCNWKVGLHFGPVLFRVDLQPGTRLLRLDVPPDPRVLDRLKREFGHEIMTRNPLKVIPRNKRLTLDESIQLARHHNHRRWNCNSDWVAWNLHHGLLMGLRPILMRHGIHGWGESSDILGIAIFNTDRITPREVIVSLPTPDLAMICNNFMRTDGPHASLDAMIQTMHLATNPGALNTRKWFHQANRILNPTRKPLPSNSKTNH
jgi:hypothetical protein